MTRRMLLKSGFVIFVVVVAIWSVGFGQQEASYTYAITGARIVPVSSAAIDNGTIVFTDGLITAVGANVDRARRARSSLPARA